MLFTYDVVKDYLSLLLATVSIYLVTFSNGSMG